MTCACWPGEKRKETRRKDYEESHTNELERDDDKNEISMKSEWRRLEHFHLLRHKRTG